ncbi:MAG: DAK2 domain-containing protein [Clostridiales bacterium]|nr:DAK2 domain-containing protein [Clostridiales bacterium]
MQKSINSVMFRKMLNASAKILDENKKLVDSLNVFPVPDGDTGTNMNLTYNSAIKEVNNCLDNSFAAISESLSKGALRGARGNSGVILSQILKGMSSVLAKAEESVTTKVFAKALVEGSNVAYKAVTKPKEGTILTVIRTMAESATKTAKKVSDFEEFFSIVLQDAEFILQQTPEMLPVLKKAGVVDAGGRGLIVIFTGMQRILSGDEELDLTIEEMINNVAEASNSNEVYVNLENLAEIEFAYCTEFMVSHMKKKTTESDIDKLRENLMNIGDSVVCVGDLQLVKVHVHTNEPNLALGYALDLGEIINIKIENMVEQNRELKRMRNQQQENLKEFGIVAVAPGEGIANVFSDLLVDNIIEGGQTMNPSADDIAKAVDKVPARNVFVLPNNKNIILAAEQAKNLTNKFIYVIPTTSVPEGISAVLGFNLEGTLEENMEAMMSGKDSVQSASVTYAVRTTHVDGFDLNQGDIIGLDNKSIIAKGSLVKDTTLQLLDKMVTPDSVNITLFYGKDINEEEAQTLVSEVEAKYDQCDVTLLPGGQPVYYYIISIE